MKEHKVFTFIKNGPFNIKDIAVAVGMNYQNTWARINGKMFATDKQVKEIEKYMKQWGYKK